MDKSTDKIDLLNHNITITERQNIKITGVNKIDSFDNEEFLVQTTAGLLGIKGMDLEIIKLDTYEGSIIIKGIINALSYLEDTKQKKESTMLSRLFK